MDECVCNKADLIVEELGVSRRDEGAEAEEDWDGLRELCEVVEKLSHDRGVVHGLGHDHLGSCVRSMRNQSMAEVTIPN